MNCELIQTGVRGTPRVSLPRLVRKPKTEQLHVNAKGEFLEVYVHEEILWEDSECRANSYESHAFRMRRLPDAREQI